MRRNKISLPDKPVSNPMRAPNDELGSLSVSRHGGHELPRFGGILDAAQFALLISGNRGGVDLLRGESRVRCPKAKGSAIGALFVGSHVAREDFNFYFHERNLYGANREVFPD
jgi:hypothetical protein